MALPVPFTDADLLADIRRTMAAHAGGLDEAYIRILLTRGVGELSYNPTACPTPTVVIIVKPFLAHPERTFTEGIRVSLVSIRRNHPQALNPMIKSNNLINNALAMQEAIRSGADEALMRNQSGELVECSQSNFFLVKDGAGPDAAAGRRPAAGHHARIRDGTRRRTRRPRARRAPDAGRPARRGRGVHYRARRGRSRRSCAWTTSRSGAASQARFRSGCCRHFARARMS